MRFNRFDKIEISGILVLVIGVALLAFTFLNAYWFLQEPLSILGAAEFTQVFGEALTPLIVTCVRVMYMGIMGWIGSLLTLRGLALLTRPKMIVEPQVKVEPKKVEAPQKVAREAKKYVPSAKPEPETKPEAKPETREPEKPKQPQAEKPKEEVEQPPQEQPEIVVIPPTPQPVPQETPSQE